MIFSKKLSGEVSGSFFSIRRRIDRNASRYAMIPLERVLKIALFARASETNARQGDRSRRIQGDSSMQVNAVGFCRSRSQLKLEFQNTFLEPCHRR
jgi:hypothetical protein